MFLHKFDFKTLIKVFNEILMRFSFEKKKKKKLLYLQIFNIYSNTAHCYQRVFEQY